MSAEEDLQSDSPQDSPLADDTPELMPDRASHNEEDDDDLFGDSDGGVAEKPRRALDDEDLDSGDDLGRDDRIADTVEDDDEQEPEGRPLRLIDCDVPRINYPQGNEFYMLNLPAFLGIQHKAFDEATYEPQTLAHDGDSSRETSSYSTAMSSMFWRRDPDNPMGGDLQSTARFIRWEDGSLTLQLATKPTEQYKVNTTAMRQNFQKKLPPGTAYDPAKDSHTFLAAAQETGVFDLQLVQPLDASMKIQPAGGATDESQLRLRQALLTAKMDHDPLARIKEVKEDPEMARRAAEQFEKDRIRAQRKRENAEERQSMRRQGVLGRTGLGGSRGVGLSVAGLEDDVGMPISRGSKKPRRKTNRHGEIYSDDEDETMPRGRTREDEYDREDDFLADSDEELEEYDDNDGLPDDDDPDKDDLEIEGRKTVLEDRRRRERDRTPKRSRLDEIDDDEDDAEGEPDDELLRNSPQAARKKRRVIDDDEEED